MNIIATAVTSPIAAGRALVDTGAVPSIVDAVARFRDLTGPRVVFTGDYVAGLMVGQALAAAGVTVEYRG